MYNEQINGTDVSSKSPEWLREAGKYLLENGSGDRERLVLGVEFLTRAHKAGDKEASFLVALMLLRGLIRPDNGDAEGMALSILQRLGNGGDGYSSDLLDRVCAARYLRDVASDVVPAGDPGFLLGPDGKELTLRRCGRLCPVSAMLDRFEDRGILSLRVRCNFLISDDELPEPERFREWVKEGIGLWDGDYEVFGGQKLTVTTQVDETDSVFGTVPVLPLTGTTEKSVEWVGNNLAAGQKKKKILSVLRDKRSFTSVSRRWRVGGLRSIWIRSDDFTSRCAEEIVHVSKHEFGHVLGLGDLYRDDEAGYEGVPFGAYPELDCYHIGDRNYRLVMCDHHAPVTNNDIEMVLLAFRDNRAQLFQNEPGRRGGVISGALGTGN